MSPSTVILHNLGAAAAASKRQSLSQNHNHNDSKPSAIVTSSMYHSKSAAAGGFDDEHCGTHLACSTEQESPLLKAEAERCRDDLEILKMMHGVDSPKLAEPLCRLGLLYQHMARDYTTALQHHCEALRILYEAAGSQEPLCKLFARDIAYILVDIGMIHEARAENKIACEKYSEAVRLFGQARIIETDAQLNAAKCGLERVGPHL
mmetsp:Transcript_26449/g.37293  ORF Transcript_26449/g.37293 Transcript_26449/m.37293 type:complete len:206 (-) Transcript_26449:38-655(-)